MIRLHELNDGDYDFFDDIEAELNRADDIERAARISQEEEMASEFYDVMEKEFWRENP